jgi:hypothetical protein
MGLGKAAEIEILNALSLPKTLSKLTRGLRRNQNIICV